MKLIASPGDKKFSELAETLLSSKAIRPGTDPKEATARLLAANPQLGKSTLLPAGAPVIVPDDIAGESTELPSPGNNAALAAVRELHGMIPEIREALTSAYSTGKTQERAFTSGLHAVVAAEQGVKGTKAAARLKTISEASAALNSEADKNKSAHTQGLATIARDLNHFLELHDRPRSTK